jgi:hypothetical protein
MNRYNSIDIKKSEEGRNYIATVIYPAIPRSSNDTYTMTTDGDRYDTLAFQFYNDSSLWWIIAVANTFRTSALPLKPGVQLRIPADTETIISDFIELNNNR